MITKRTGQLAEGNQAWLKLEKEGKFMGKLSLMERIAEDVRIAILMFRKFVRLMYLMVERSFFVYCSCWVQACWC